MGPDQVQSGYGRTGRMWAHEHAAVTPDVLVMAKGIASGLPLSAISARAELTSRVPAGAMGGTYAANPVACAAALATLDVFDEEGLVANAAAREHQRLCTHVQPLDQRGACLRRAPDPRHRLVHG